MTIDFDLQSDIQKLIDFDALELYFKETGEFKDIFIPYMMNDAVECYIHLKKCNVVGGFEKDLSIEDFTITSDGEKKGLIIRQCNNNMVSIWYESDEKIVECYQYHRIGHFWIKGQEQWRRLVYIIGTIHDKYSFMGEDICNERELNLLPLVEFPPFRYWSPITDNLDEYYVTSRRAIDTFREIALQVDDKKLIKMIDTYEKAFRDGNLSEKRIEKFASILMKSRGLYNYLNNEIDQASLSYKRRSYSQADNQRLEDLCNNQVEIYRKKGYSGEYPVLSKGKSQVVFYEEHPFVLREFEYEDYDFKVHALEFKM